MNVLLTVASSSVTGPAERVLGNALALTAAGHRATVAYDTVRPGDFTERARALGVSCEPGLSLCRSPTPAQVLRDVSRLRALIREGRADVLHSHFSHDHHVALGAAWPLRERVRVIRAAETDENLAPGWARRLAYRRTDGFEVATASRAHELTAELGVPRERVAVLPGAVDAERFAPLEREAPSRLRQALKVAPGEPLIGIVARMKPERRHRELIAAFAMLRADFPKARLALIGRGEGEPTLRAQVARLGLDQTVLFAGYWGGADLVEAYRGLDLAVWLADGNDGTARGVLEAMACGVPVVAGVGSSAEALVASVDKSLIAEGGELFAYEALVRLLQAPQRWKALGCAAREQVLARHTWAQRGPALLAFYERLRALPPV